MLKPRKLKVRTHATTRLKVRIKQQKLKYKIRLGGQIVMTDEWEIPDSLPQLVDFWLENGAE